MPRASAASTAPLSDSANGLGSEWILVVEDDASLLALIERCLTRNGHQTVGVRDGASALSFLEKGLPRLMVLDYSLPDMRGEQLLEHMERLGKRVPFVVATGHGSESVAVEMMKRGAYDYLVKGTTFVQLLPAVVEQAVERARQAERLAKTEEQLLQAHEELEQRVQQRTAELAEANQRLRIEMEERRRAEEQVQQHQAELAHVARLSTAGEMVAELAHELNQPLSAICSYAQACKRLLASERHESGEDFSAMLNQVNEQANRAAEIIRRLRQFVAKAKPVQAAVDINAMVRDVVDLMTLDARKASAEVHLELREPLPPVHGDRIQLEQVLVNLVRNAFEALQESEGGARQLTIRTDLDEKHCIVVDVRDNGIGIRPDVAERIFDRFFTTKAEGMGMGLPISQSILESHGGRLCVICGGEEGAAFRFTLPLEREGVGHAN